MRLENLSAAEVIAEVYGHYQPKGCWDPSKLGLQTDTGKEAPRLYCYSCSQHSTLKRLPPDPKDPKKRDRYHCRSCDETNTRVKWLQRKGTITDTTDFGHADYSWRMVDAMMASRVIAAIEACDKPVKSLALWSHTSEGTGTHEYQLILSIRDRFDAACDIKVRGLTHAIQVVTLIAAMVKDRQAGKRSRRGCKRLSSLVGVDESQFKAGRGWAKIKRFIEDVLAEYESALKAVVNDAVEKALVGSAPYVEELSDVDMRIRDAIADLAAAGKL